MKRRLLLAFAFSIGLIPQTAWSQTAAPQRDRPMDLAVVFARTLNTAAVTYRVEHNSYPTWEQLVKAFGGEPVTFGIDFNSTAAARGIRCSLEPKL